MISISSSHLRVARGWRMPLTLVTLGVAAAVTAMIGSGAAVAVPASTNVTTERAVPPIANYPWAGLASGADQWGMGYGQCVSYVAWMIYQNDGGVQHPAQVPAPGWFPSDGLAVSPVRYAWGDAGDWGGSARGAGYPVNATPHVGAVAEWNRGSDGGQFAVGHVAYITAVNADGSIDLAQFNLREDGRFSTLHMPRGGATDTSNGHSPFYVSWPDNFLHIGDATISSGTPYRVSGVDNAGLAIQSQPHVNHVVRYVPNGTTLYVACQTRNGDQVDGRMQYGRPFTTWDRLTDGTFAYDFYLDTPAVATDGYSPGIAHCAGG